MPRSSTSGNDVTAEIIIEKDTHEDVGGDCDIRTSSTATNPSTAFLPFAITVMLWLIPMLVFGRSPEM